MAISRDLQAAIAVTRFGLGARPGEIEEARGDPQGFLSSQIRPSGAEQPQTNPVSSADRIAEFRDYQQDRRQTRRAAAAEGASPGTPGAPGAPGARDPVQMAARMLRQDAGVDFHARAQLAARTSASFRERWTLFWCNHFTVSATKLVTATVVGPFEQEAIRPAVFGPFEEMLIGSSAHPAMILYLDQAQSVGPHTLAARFMSMNGKQAGLNENLAREIMELHTVGLEAGYTQKDVTAFAQAMTGWSIGGLREPDERARGRFMFRSNAHEPGSVTIMGKTYPNKGVIQARDVMVDLARSPNTARHIAVKLGRHFVADDPPPALTARLEANFLKTGGRLDELARTLIASPEAWEAEPRKFKTPYEFIVSSWRAADFTPQSIAGFAPVMKAMGQQPFSAPSPKGWAEEAAVWCAPDAVVKRMAWSEAYAAAVIGDRDPKAIAEAALGARLTPPVAQAIARAETRPEALAILLMSPEFQRR